MQTPIKPHTQSGIVLVSAIFIVVVMALLLSFGLSLVRSHSTNILSSHQGVRAFYAARAGLARGLWSLKHKAPNCDAFPLTALQLQGDLRDFTVNVACTLTTYRIDGKPVHIIAIKAVSALRGSAANEAGYASREASALVKIT